MKKLSIYDFNNLDNLIGWCKECKDSITSEDDYVKDRGKLYCTFCYKQIKGIVEELHFE